MHSRGQYSCVQILTGPRPQATTRPKRAGPKPIAVTAQGRWKGTHGSDRPPAKVRSSEAALAALGPEDCATKFELETALKSAKKQSYFVRIDRDTKIAAARERVSRLGAGQGCEMLASGLQAQIREREAFIEKAKKKDRQNRQARGRSSERGGCPAHVEPSQSSLCAQHSRSKNLHRSFQIGLPKCSGCKRSWPSCKNSPNSQEGPCQPQVPIQSGRGCEQISWRTGSKRCRNGCGTANKTCRKPSWQSGARRWAEYPS